MCGIAGWINLKEDIGTMGPVLEKMSETLKNRGPDAHGEWYSPHAMLVHRRLAVVDPAGGAQPMVRQAGGHTYVVTYNGELYNTLDLRRELELRGYGFSTHCDTEVLLTAYMEWGPDCTRRLNGIYAFGIWSERDKSFFLARDRFGVKPLFYYLSGDSLIFGSELKALLAHPQVKPVVDHEGLGEIFCLGPARTPGHGIYRNVHELKPGCSLLYSPDGIREECYWTLLSEPHSDSPEETIEKVSYWVRDAVTRQLVSDVPLCTFLSGGLDSSIISTVAALHFKERQEVLPTYSIDYKENDKHFQSSLFQPDPDAPWVKRMAEYLGCEHHAVMLDTTELADALYDATMARDLPGMADIDSSLYLFCKEIKKHMTVGLSGECADEVFGGYPWFHHAAFMNADTFPWSRSLDVRLKVLSQEFIQAIKPYDYVARRYEETLAKVPRLEGESALEARRREIFYLNITWFMGTLLERKDRMSMAHGLEVRVPYCDHRLVQYVWNIPWDLKMAEGREKGLLRKAMEGLLPNDVLWRKKSPYPKTHNPSYTRAVKEWMGSILSDGSSPLLPFVNKKALREIIDSPDETGKPWFGQLMAAPQLLAWLIQIDIWLKRYGVVIDF